MCEVLSCPVNFNFDSRSFVLCSLLRLKKNYRYCDLEHAVSNFMMRMCEMKIHV